MGLLFSKLVQVFGQFTAGEPARILMLGLDAAGKTTILYKIKLNENVSTIPTIGFNVETVSTCKGVSFTVWDVGGQDKIRRLWRHYFNHTEGLVYVVDSSDRTRLEESRDELWAIMDDDAMRDVPVVIMANKQDMPGAMRPFELIDGLHLRKLQSHKWHVQGTCAVNGEGVYESMESMSTMVKNFRTSKR